MSTESNQATAEREFARLLGLRLLRTWNVLATRFFYFGASENAEAPCMVRLELECPWRIQKDSRIIVGSEDYASPARGNTDPDWDPNESQQGHLQDQLLEETFGSVQNGEIFFDNAIYLVESVVVDEMCGFKIILSGGYVLAAFPTSGNDMEWILSTLDQPTLYYSNGEVGVSQKAMEPC